MAQRKLERVRTLLDGFQGKAFTSADVQQAYEQRHGERIALSTVCPPSYTHTITDTTMTQIE